jgi:hypothetical protein
MKNALLALSLLGLLGCEAPSREGDAPEEPIPRQVLHEMFTGSTCGPCLEADANLIEIHDANPDRYVLLSYQIGSDPYVSREGIDRRMYYLPPEESTYSIPWLHADGVNGLHPNLANDEEGYLQSDFDDFAAVETYLGIEVSHSVSDQTVSWDITLSPGQAIDSEDLLLQVAIIEGVTYDNIGTNGQTEFHHVMKKMSPDDEGSALAPLVAGEPVELGGSYTFEGDYAEGTGISNMVAHDSEHTVEEFEDLSVVVWVQDDATREVHQAAWSGEE